MGIVVLAVTGVEALYADLGHFGARPIRMSWLGIVYPAHIITTCFFFYLFKLSLPDPQLFWTRSGVVA